MPPEKNDAAHLFDMHRYAQEAVDLAARSTLEQYESNRQMQLAVERIIEIIGEAARRVSHEYQLQHPEIPWRQIVAQRHVLAHEYGEIQADRIWLIVTLRLPDLIAKLKPLIPPQPEF